MKDPTKRLLKSFINNFPIPKHLNHSMLQPWSSNNTSIEKVTANCDTCQYTKNQKITIGDNIFRNWCCGLKTLQRKNHPAHVPSYQLLQDCATNILILWSKFSFEFRFIFSVQLKNVLWWWIHKWGSNKSWWRITIKTSSGELSWSNRVVGRHNSTLSRVLDKVLKDGKCDFGLTFYW